MLAIALSALVGIRSQVNTAMSGTMERSLITSRRVCERSTRTKFVASLRYGLS
ncbi:MAG: hypothetical protein KME12_17695 [Trichocoleus desertorum ATA4-8-CV12]|jgi:hypothetical protein|nr:hypothetical protein [Trichocoleus desertorum ATA4-8-CV12]